MVVLNTNITPATYVTVPFSYVGNYHAWEDSPYRRRIEALGFVFKELSMNEESDRTTVISAVVLCTCGIEEHVHVRLGHPHHLLLVEGTNDPYQILFNLEFFTPDHLEKDGFPPEVIEQAKAIYYAPFEDQTDKQVCCRFDLSNG